MAEVPTLAGYVLGHMLGEGAHGVVYKAHTVDDVKDVVALKVVEHTGSIEKLLLEPELLARFSHPNIVRLRDYSIRAGKLVLVMEYIDGPSLDEYLKARGTCRPEEVREFLRQMADALSHAHALGVFHSDLKPGNIIVQSTLAGPRYVIVDFGVSRMVEGIQRRRRVSGTYNYMAPEQLRGRGGKAADLWALGAIAYRMLTGVQPFEASTMSDLTKRVLYVNPTFPATVETDDEELQRIVMHLLEKNVIERTDSASALTTELNVDRRVIEAFASAAGNRTTSQGESGVRAEIRRRWNRVVFFVAMAFLPDGIYPAIYTVGGAVLVWLGSERRRPWYVVAGFVLIIGGSLFVPDASALFGLDATTRTFIPAVSLFFGLLFIPAGVELVKIRRLQRDLLLFSLIREGGAEDSLGVLKAYVEVNVGDIHAHERYIEGLLAADRAEDAAVEALTLLRVDPYNFDASLLLAHAYLELGLLDRCKQVCNGYLEVSGHCFEFQDVLDRAKGQERSAA
jgi:eukaryotic-like serine/threonine-protein kinase